MPAWLQVPKLKLQIIEIGLGFIIVQTPGTRRSMKRSWLNIIQHAQLRTILQQDGHRVTILPISLGSYKNVFKCFNDALTKVGVQRSAQDKFLRKLVDLACQSHANMLKQRRFLDTVKKPPDK